MQPDRQLLVTAGSARLRRSLTPSAWVVLEELALGVDTAGVATTNSRRLASDLGMSKDTAARAMQRLIVIGLAERIERRDDSTGQFGSIAYRVDLAAAGLVVQRALGPMGETTPDSVTASAAPATPPRSGAARRPTSRAIGPTHEPETVGSDERSERSAETSGSEQRRSTSAPTTSRRQRARRTAPDRSSDGTDQLELFGPDSMTRADLANRQDD